MNLRKTITVLIFMRKNICLKCHKHYFFTLQTFSIGKDEKTFRLSYIVEQRCNIYSFSKLFSFLPDPLQRINPRRD